MAIGNVNVPGGGSAWEIEKLKKEVIPIERGGHGGKTAKEARENLEITPANIEAYPHNTSTRGDVDLNTLITPGEYEISLSASNGNIEEYNSPIEGTVWIHLWVMGNGVAASGGRITQVAFLPFLNDRSVYVRYCHDGYWCDWEAMYTSGNKPALTDLSGILSISNGGTGATDAATARTNLGVTPANIGALPLTGGTLTGTTKVQAGLYVGPANTSNVRISASSTQGNVEYVTADNAVAANIVMYPGGRVRLPVLQLTNYYGASYGSTLPSSGVTGQVFFLKG